MQSVRSVFFRSRNDAVTFRGEDARKTPTRATIRESGPRVALTEDVNSPLLALPSVLVVDPDDASRCRAEQYLARTARWKVRALGDLHAAVAILATRAFEAVLVALPPDPDDSLPVLEMARARRPRVPIVVVGHHDEAAEAIDRVHRLASRYLMRPSPMADVERALRTPFIPV